METLQIKRDVRAGAARPGTDAPPKRAAPFRIPLGQIPKGSFLQKAFRSFLVIVILTTALLTTFLTVTYLRTTVTLINRYNDKLIAQTNYSITYQDDLVKRLRDTLLSDRNIIAFLNMAKNDPYTAMIAGQTVDKHVFASSNDIESVQLFNAELDLFYSSATGEQNLSGAFSDQTTAALLKDPAFVAAHTGRPIALHTDPLTGRAKMCTYVIFEQGTVANGLRNAIVINIKTSVLTNSIRGINQYPYLSDNSFMVVDAQGTILGMELAGALETNAADVSTLGLSAAGLVNTPNTRLKMDSGNYLVACFESSANSWYILGITPMESVFRDVVSASLIATGLVILVLILCAALCLHLARRLNSPVQAITQIMRGGKAGGAETTVETEEFQYILSVFQSMQAQNRQLDRMMNQTGYTAKQDFFNALIGDSYNLSFEQAAEKLRGLNLEYVAQNPLCMCLLKIDNYSAFASQNNQKERWAMRYAIVNIAMEVAEGHAVCEAFCSSRDQFVMLFDCSAQEGHKALQSWVEPIIKLVQQTIGGTLNLSLSAAYSTRFTGLEHLPSMYASMRDSILLKIRYGHGCIIAPHLMDELEAGNFQMPSKKENQLLQKVLEGDATAALHAYADISGQLYQHAYNEIISCQVYLAYTIYATVLEKKPALKADTNFALQAFLQDIQNAETGAEIDKLMGEFLRQACRKVEMANGETQSGADAMVQRVVEIVEQEYPDPGLCLSAIAEKLRLSPNYIGYLFKSARQQSISQYIYELRMQKLDGYMRTTNLSLPVILDKVGLEKNNYFYTKFKKHFGVPLGEYKLQLSAQTDDKKTPG